MLKKHPVLMILSLLLGALVLAFVVTGILIMTFSSGSGEFDYLLVLGTTVNGTEPSPMLRDRINAAYAYLTAHEDVICVVSGGKGVGDEKGMKLVEDCAKEASSELGSFTFRGVTEGISYTQLRMLDSLPCGQDMYYDRYRRFFYILSQKRGL